MQWVRKRLGKNGDRGSVAVMVALLMTVFLAMAALAVDVGAMHVDRQQLRTGADAGALAIAQDCARNDCTAVGDTAQTMANLNRSGASGTILEINESSGTVSVETTAEREHWFAPIFGIHSSGVQATASARWGYPTGGTAVMPLTISWCELENQPGISIQRDPSTGVVTGVDIADPTESRTIMLAKLSESSPTDCDGPTGKPTGGKDGKLPGGFGWLRPSAESCARTASIIDGWVGTDPGASLPSGCSEAHFKKWVGQTVLLPIFYEVRGEGSSGQYRIFGYAAFTLSGYRFPGVRYPSPAPCAGGERCISGRFDRFVDLSENFDYSPSGPQLGAAVVALTE